MGAFGSQLLLGRVAHEASPRPERSSELAGFLSASSCFPSSWLSCCRGAASPPCPPALCARWTQGMGAAFRDSPLCHNGGWSMQSPLLALRGGDALTGSSATCSAPSLCHGAKSWRARGLLRSRDLPRGHCPGHPGASSPKQPKTKGERPRVR